MSLPSFIVSQGSGASGTWKWRAHDSDAMTEVFVVWYLYQHVIHMRENITYTNRYYASSSTICLGDMLHTIPLAACRLL